MNVFTCIFKKQSVNISLFSAFKHNEHIKVVYNTQGTFFIYVFNYGFIDQSNGEINLLFAKHKVRALFVGVRPRFKTITIDYNTYTPPFGFIKEKAPIIRQNTKPSLVKKLSIKTDNLNILE